MFLITLAEHQDGVYSVIDEEGDHVVYFFREEDDAERYLGLLEANDEEDNLPSLVTHEIDAKSGVGMCELRGMKYIIVEPDDIIIPPRSYDNLQDD
jgi:hypothetical protein